MSIANVLMLLGGLGLFLYGMQMMGFWFGSRCRQPNETHFGTSYIQPDFWV